MSFLSRAAAFAVLTLSCVGLAQSAPGIAAELARPAVTSISADANPDIAAVGGVTTATAVSTTQNHPVLTPAVETIDDDPSMSSAKFDSLDAAVAAQNVADADDEDLRCLASAIFFESHGEPIAGQLAVAEVILNRTKSGRFPSSICGVIKQPGQFSFVRRGSIPSIDESRRGYRTALAVAKVAMTGAWDGQADDALFFHARRVGNGGRFVRVASIGNHVFYR